MTYTEEILKRIVQCGTLGYPASKIVNVLEIEESQAFFQDFDNSESQVYAAYKKGLDKADFMLDSKLFELAKDGDKKAMEMYEARKKQQQEASKREQEKRLLNKSKPK